MVATRISAAAQILISPRVLRFTRAARNLAKFNQAAVNFKILSTQRTLVQA